MIGVRDETGRFETRRQGIHDESGLAMLEVAVVAPLLLLILFAIIQFGIVYAQQQVITQAASAGARAGALFQPPPCSDQSMRDDANDAANEFGGRFGLPTDFQGTFTGGCNTRTVSYTVTFNSPIPVVSALAGLFGAGLSTEIPLRQDSTEFNANFLAVGG